MLLKLPQQAELFKASYIFEALLFLAYLYSIYVKFPQVNITLQNSLFPAPD
jgi:hypothetical protein